MPEKYNEVVIVVNRNNRISDFTLYSLGLKDSAELEEMMEKAKKGEKIEATAETSYSYDEILGLEFKLLLNSDYFKKEESGVWVDKTDDSLFVSSQLENAEKVKVVGILRPSAEAVNEQTSGFVGYKR